MLKVQAKSAPKKAWCSWLHEMKVKRTHRAISCHICGDIGPFPASTECAGCHIWVCSKRRCRRFARVQDHLPYWYCCHCLLIPLQCTCELGLKEASKIILKTEMLHPRVATLAEETEPLFPAELRKLRFQRQPSVLKGGLEQLEAEHCFIDDAAICRRLTLLEFTNLTESLKDLKLNIARTHKKFKQMLCWNWLTEIQSFGTPDMMLSRLIQHHSTVEKHMIYRHKNQVPRQMRYVTTYLEAEVGGWKLPLKNDDFIEQESRDKLQERLVKKEQVPRRKYPTLWRELMNEIAKDPKEKEKMDQKEKITIRVPYGSKRKADTAASESEGAKYDEPDTETEDEADKHRRLPMHGRIPDMVGKPELRHFLIPKPKRKAMRNLTESPPKKEEGGKKKAKNFKPPTEDDPPDDAFLPVQMPDESGQGEKHGKKKKAKKKKEQNDEVDELDELDEPLGDHMTPHIQALRQACANGRPESEDVMPLVDAIRYAYLNPPIGRKSPASPGEDSQEEAEKDNPKPDAKSKVKAKAKPKAKAKAKAKAKSSSRRSAGRARFTFQ